MKSHGDLCDIVNAKSELDDECKLLRNFFLFFFFFL